LQQHAHRSDKLTQGSGGGCAAASFHDSASRPNRAPERHV